MCITKKGNLTIFTSYTPGAGKSHYMLKKASAFAGEGKNVVIGFLNSAHRDISKMIENFGMKKVFRKKYSLNKIKAMKPDLVVMDEMGMHGYNKDNESFVYEDIIKLLNLGIDVYTSTNLKRFESINPKFHEITGIRIRKTIPDEYLDLAEKIYFVDRDPKLMVQDYENGKIFAGEQTSPTIMKKNFDIENLNSYRKLSLKILQEKYSDKLEIYKRNFA